jgi:hypothetical protein
MMLQIKAPHFVVGLILKSYPNLGPVCTNAPPIIKYMVGWTETRIRAYCTKKNWRCEEIKDGRVTESPTESSGNG